MAKIYKAEDIFKPLTPEQKKIADARAKKLYAFTKGKITLGEGDIFNLKAY